jgi:hypothetical protein
MKNYPKARGLILASWLASLLALTACSYATNFVVINASDHVVEVRYKVKYTIDPRQPLHGLRLAPDVKKISEVDEQIAWEDLPASRLTVDPESRTVVVSLMPGYGLRVEQLNMADDPDPLSSFSIEELVIQAGPDAIKLQGEQVYKSFVPESKSTHTLTYR